jgi:hypothetical protein
MADFVMRRWELEPVPGAPGRARRDADTSASVLVTMTPEIDALIRELHQVPTEQREAVWGRFNSALV